MPTILRTNSENADFIELVKLLDADLAIRDGEDHSFYAQFNKTYMLKNVVVVYDNNQAVSCGAVRELEPGVMEVKRMYTREGFREKGWAGTVLRELESWCREMGYKTCVLETGMKQPEAIHMYEKKGYTRIPNYGQYANISNSVCFEKIL